MILILRRLGRALLVPRGDRRWDLFLRATCAVVLLAIPVLHFFPDSGLLVGYAIASVVTNSPLSPVVPVAFEPLIMEAAKYTSILNVTVIGLVAYMYTEYLNWHLYRWVLDRKRLATLRKKPWVERSVASFARAPFLTTVVFAFTPLPFWVSRILAIYQRYPFWHFMAATAVGRAPRILLYAWLGAALNVPTVLLASAAVGATLLVVAIRLARRQPVLEDAALDTRASDSPAAASPAPSKTETEPR